MRLWNKSLKLWLGSAAILATLLLASTPVAAYLPGNGNDPGGPSQGDENRTIPTPEPATLTLLALGGGAVVLARYRSKSRRK
jgi:hypothetical protein